MHIAYTPNAETPSVRRVSAAESATRLYVKTLNVLAHPAHGLDAVTRIAEHVHSFVATTGDLPETCAMILAAVDNAAHEIQIA